MKGKFFLLAVLLLTLIGTVSAGLCKGSDGYYHQCTSYLKKSCDSKDSGYNSGYYRGYNDDWEYEKVYYYTYDNSYKKYSDAKQTETKKLSDSSWRYKEEYETSDYKYSSCQEEGCVRRASHPYYVGVNSYVADVYVQGTYKGDCLERGCLSYGLEDKHWNSYYYKPRYDSSGYYNWRW